jgi:hypothetical protein
MTSAYPKMKAAIGKGKDLRLELRSNKSNGTYRVTDEKVRKLLEYRHSIEDMKLILDPVSYLFIFDAIRVGKKITLTCSGDEYQKHFHAFQIQLIEYFLEKYSTLYWHERFAVL